jgi:hypothetical protein
MKKSLFMVFLIMLLMVLPSHSFASNHGSDFEAQYIPCPEGGFHTMYSHGKGELSQDGEELIASGYAWQCSKCKEVIVSENNPLHYGVNSLGTYGVQQVGWNLRTSYSMTDPDYVDYNSSLDDPPWDSYQWYY